MERKEVLSQYEKFRIEMAETYRFEVRKNIENKKTPDRKIWEFLNSSFGLWVLSTCVVGFITFLYSEYQSRVHDDLGKKQEIVEHARRNASLVTVLLPYLSSQEEKQWRIAIEVTRYLKKQGELPGELESALIGIVNISDTSKSSHALQAKVNEAAAVIDLGKSNNAMSGTLPPRVYIQIPDERQREIAKSLQNILREEKFIAPGIENVVRKSNAIVPEKTQVRYYREEEKSEALRLISILKKFKLNLTIQDKPEKISGDGRGTRPGHYEIWLSKS